MLERICGVMDKSHGLASNLGPYPICASVSLSVKQMIMAPTSQVCCADWCEGSGAMFRTVPVHSR